MNSPRDLIESQFPSYFLEQYPQFVKFIEEYYDFLESSIAIFEDKKNCKVGDVIYGSLSKAKAIVKIIADNKIYFDYETPHNNFYKNEIVLNGNTGQTYYIKNLYKNIYSFARDVEENTAYDTVQNMFKKYFKRNISLDHSIFSRLDPNTLTKKILEYYKNRGTENSYYWFFRIFFDDVIELYYPKVDILRLSDTYHIEKRWIQIVYHPHINNFEKTRIIGKKSKATATVRRVQEKSRNNQTRAYLDLIYINGTFLEGEEISGHDIITGEKIVTGFIKGSITGINVEDGGIGHKVGDEFSFHDGIGEITHLEKYSITNINITNPGHFYSVGNYVVFDNQYAGATAYANAYVDVIEPNYVLSDYVNFVNNTLKYNPVEPYEPSALLDYLNSNTFANTNLFTAFSNPYTFIGSIKSIKMDKSGLNYKFNPNAKVINPSYQAQNLYLFNVFLDTLNANTDLMLVNSIVAIDGEPAVYAGTNVISEDDVYFEDTDILIEDPYLHTFYGHKGLINDLTFGTQIEFFANTDPQTVASILLKTYNANNAATTSIVNYHSYEALGETARIETELGYGVSKIKITEPGMLVNDDHDICFITGPEKRTVESNNVIHHLDTTFSYKHGVLFDSIEEYKENNSTLSSEKHIQDNFYYQSFSYEITTKIPAEIIEPLLLDELHPAGFIAFIRNKIDEEVSMHLKAYEFPRIEIEAEGATFENEVMPYMVQMQERFHNMNRDEAFWDAGFDSADYDQLFDKTKDLTFDGNRKKQFEHLYTFVEVDNKIDSQITDLVEQELENNDFVDVFEGFRLYVEDYLIRPESKSFQEFRKCDGGPFFDSVSFEHLFDMNQDSANVVYFDNDGTCIPTGYGTSKEYSRLEQEYMYYDGHVAVESFMQLVLLEDEANWKTDPIGRYKGTIGERKEYIINNHKANIEHILQLKAVRNVGGKIVVRDWLGEASKFRFDNQLIFLDANNYFDVTKNFSGEFYNYTPNPIWYFDNNDANNVVDDFSNNNTINPVCYTPHHVHNSFNFSNVPATGYIPIVSGNTLANKGSYLPTTEILTRDRGYIAIKDLSSKDHVAFVKDNGKIIWKIPDRIIKENYKGVMYNFTDYNRMSVTVTPDQDLVLYDDRLLPRTIKAKKIKSDRINLPRFIHDSFALVDTSLIGTPQKALLDYIPVDERIHKNVIQYDGDVYCLIFNEYEEFIPVQNDINNVDLALLQIASKINNDYTLPKFEPISINYTNHDMYKNHITIDVERRDTILYLESSNSIVFDFNASNDANSYISFVSEGGLQNSYTIKNSYGPRFDHVKPSQTFDDTGGYGFDNTAERFRVNPIRMYYGNSEAKTKVPKGYEQVITTYKDANNLFGKAATTYFDYVENYLNKDADGNTIGTEIFTYNADHLEMKVPTADPKSRLTTEVFQMLYPVSFGTKVTFDIANLSPPGCINGFFDYIGANSSFYKFDSNTANAPIFSANAGLRFDYGNEDHCNYDSMPKGRLGLFNTFDTERRTWDQVNDLYVESQQYIEPEQILTNSADQWLVANNENSAGMRNMHPPSELIRIGETMGSAVVATIKNYRVDLKKKFFDSIIWEFDRNYSFSSLSPLEHSGFDSVEQPKELNLKCINLFFDNDSKGFTDTTIGYKTRNNGPIYWDSEGFKLSEVDTKYDRLGWLWTNCEVDYIPFPFDDVYKSISTHIEYAPVIDGYGPYNLSKSFDSSMEGHGFDREKYPYFDNEQGGAKPFILTEPKIINIDTADVSLINGKNDPLQTLILAAEDAHTRKLETEYEQILINWNQIVICTKDYITEDDVIRDFEFSLIWRYLFERGCDPSSTKGTSAYYEPFLINHDIQHMEIESEADSILYNPLSFIDASVSDAHTNHMEMEIYSDILSCDPIRYTDIIYSHRRDRIGPYVDDICLSKDRIKQTETDFDAIIITEETYYANTLLYDNHEIEIYSHEGNDIYPDAFHVYANNAYTISLEMAEVEVAQHIGSRNCAISTSDRLYNFMDVDILDCHLKETIRFWIWDTIPTTKNSESFSQIIVANTEIDFDFQPRTILTIDPVHMPSNTMYRSIDNRFEGPYLRYDISDKAFDELEIDTSILDRNPHIWTKQKINDNNLNKNIMPNMIPKAILDYVHDKIPSVSVSQVTDIDFIRQLESNNLIEVNNEFIFRDKFESYIDLTSDLYNQVEIDSPFDVYDRNPYINVNDKFHFRFNDLIINNMLSKPIIEYDGHLIPSVKATIRSRLENEQFGNTDLTTTTSLMNSFELAQIDATFDSYENPEIDYHFDVYDRNPYIFVDSRIFDKTLDNQILSNLLGKPIRDYDGDLIPSVTAWAFNEIETQFVANGSPFTEDSRRENVQHFFAIDSILHGDASFVDASTDNKYEHQEIETHEFIADRNMIVSLDQPYALKLDRLIINNMLGKPIVDYDGNFIPSVTVDSRPSFKHFRAFHHDLQNNTFPTTVRTLPENFVDATTYTYSEFDEFEHDNVLRNDLEFIAFRDSLAKNYRDILTDELLGFTIRENRYDTIRAMRIDEEHEIEEQHYIGPNPILQLDGTHYELGYFADTILLEDDAKRIDATTYAYVETDEFEHDNEVCDLFSIIPLDRKVLGTRWEKEYIFDADLKRPILDYSRGCIPSVTVDSTPSIQTNRTEYHDLPSSIIQEFIYYMPELPTIDMTGNYNSFDEFENDIHVPNRNQFINIHDSIDLLLLKNKIYDYDYINKILTDYDKYAIPSVTVDLYSEYEEQHYIGPNPEIQIGGSFSDTGRESLTFDNNIYKFAELTEPKIKYGTHYELEYKQDFTISYSDIPTLDSTMYTEAFDEVESTYAIYNADVFFDLTKRIGPYKIYHNDYGDEILDKIIGDKLLNKLLTDYPGDKHFVNIATEYPNFEHDIKIGPNELGGSNYVINYTQDTLVYFADALFADNTMERLKTEESMVNAAHIYHKKDVFSLADEVRISALQGLEITENDLRRRLITDRAYHNPKAEIFEPKLERIYPEYAYGPHVPNERNLPIENKKQNVDIDQIVTSRDFEKFIDSTFLVNDGAGDKTVDKLIESMFANVEPIVYEAVPTIINRPIERTPVSTFLDTIITAGHFEKFVDSSTKDQERFTHINLNQFIDREIHANNILTENKLINRPSVNSNTSALIETVVREKYYEKFIDASKTTCSELFEYTPGRANVILKDLATIPWFSTNVSNITYSTLNAGWNFSTNTQNTSTNTVIYFSTAGPDYQLDLKPTYIDMALATQNTYAISSANNGYLNANGWQYEHQQDALPIPTANLQFESNRKIRMSVFEKFEFHITDIANTHNGYFFALGTSPWFDDNREANALFGIANGVTYELDGNVYSNFNQYKADFTSGLKANAKITFSPTLSLAQLLGSNANTVNGANSDLCPNYNVYTANTYTFYYWSNANNTIFSAGGEIEIYELNNLEECVDYSINKTSYIDNIRVSKEVMCA